MTETCSKLTRIPALGVGLGYRDPYRGDLFLHREQVDFLEIIADHFLDAVPDQAAQCNLLAAHFPLIPHGLNLSLGSAEGPDTNYVRQITGLVNRLRPPYWSEHIAFTRAGGVEIGHLTPLPFTREALETLCRNIAFVQDYTAVPLILENITSVIDLGGEMSEGQFLGELVARTGCGLLLDVTNLYTNSVNLGYDLDAFFDQAPLDQVVQLHFTGGHWHDGVLVEPLPSRTAGSLGADGGSPGPRPGQRHHPGAG